LKAVFEVFEGTAGQVQSKKLVVAAGIRIDDARG
jgi:hypothetical protein